VWKIYRFLIHISEGKGFPTSQKNAADSMFQKDDSFIIINNSESSNI